MTEKEREMAAELLEVPLEDPETEKWVEWMLFSNNPLTEMENLKLIKLYDKHFGYYTE